MEGVCLYNEIMRLSGKTALVTGGNRGIGLEVCRRLARDGAVVLLGSRDPAKGEEAAAQLRTEGLDVHPAQVDATRIDSIQALCDRLMQDRVDILVNNAAILDRQSFQELTVEQINSLLETNLRGPLLLAYHFSPGMVQRKWGRIVNVTSGMGSINGGLGSDSILYRVTKTALNAFTICLARSLQGTGVLVNSVDPGWVRTGMGGPNAPRTPAQGADSIVRAVMFPDDGPTGGFFRDGNPIPW